MSGRQLEVLRLIALGYGNRPIALMLGVSSSTAATHVKAILERLEANNRAHAAVIAYRKGMLQFDEGDIRVV